MSAASLHEEERASSAENGAPAPEAGRKLAAELEKHLRERPFVVLGAVAAVGFVAGSLFGSRLGQVLAAAAGGYALREALRVGMDMNGIRAGLDRLAGTSD
jgi:hypothetical protein